MNNSTRESGRSYQASSAYNPSRKEDTVDNPSRPPRSDFRHRSLSPEPYSSRSVFHREDPYRQRDSRLRQQRNIHSFGRHSDSFHTFNNPIPFSPPRRRSYYEPDSHRSPRQEQSPNTRRVIVNNLTVLVTEAHIQDIFSNFGEILRVNITTTPPKWQTPSDKKSGKSGNYSCHITFKDAKGAQRALTYMQGGVIDSLKVSVYHPPFNDFYNPPRYN